MPYINNNGRIVMGIGDGVVSVDWVRIGLGGGPARWLGDAYVMYQSTLAGNRLVIADTRGNVDQTLAHGANQLAAGGGHWASWLAGDGLRTSRGGHLPRAGLRD